MRQNIVNKILLIVQWNFSVKHTGYDFQKILSILSFLSQVL